MTKLHYQNTKYLKSVGDLSQLPADMGAEVAFVGRSNVGKSSALNALTHQRRLAHSSKTPGRTQVINFFEVDAEHRLVDLPGYGYAKVSRAVKKQWQQLIEGYLADRDALKGLVLLMDIRHPMTEIDQQLLTWAAAVKLPTHILLTKADKLKTGAQKSVFNTVQKQVTSYYDKATVQLFSSTKRQGIDLLRKQLDNWFAI